MGSTRPKAPIYRFLEPARNEGQFDEQKKSYKVSFTCENKDSIISPLSGISWSAKVLVSVSEALNEL